MLLLTVFATTVGAKTWADTKNNIHFICILEVKKVLIDCHEKGFTVNEEHCGSIISQVMI